MKPDLPLSLLFLRLQAEPPKRVMEASIEVVAGWIVLGIVLTFIAVW